MAVLLAIWAAIAAAQKRSLVDQIRAMLEAGGATPVAADLAVDTADGLSALLVAMVQAAGDAAGLVVAEAADQSTGIDPVQPSPAALLEKVAQSTVDTLADRMRQTAADTARANAASTADEAAQAVADALEHSTEAAERTELGGAIHGAMNTARVETLGAGPVGAVYASEKNDGNTCVPCHHVDGRWLGNTDDMARIELSYPAGAHGGYVDCLGGDRCRGTIVGVWRPKTTGGESKSAPTPAPPTSPLSGHVASGEASSKPLGGASAETHLVTFVDGGTAVRKVVTSDDIRNRFDTQDAEMLAATFARRAGVDAPDVYREARDTVYMEFIADATTGAEKFGYPISGDALAMALADSPAGRRMGLLDIALGNTDRNSGNWLVGDDGRLVAIDHGYAFIEGAIGDVLSLTTGPNNLFAHRLGGDFAAADVEHLRQVAIGMKGLFGRKHADWYQAVLDRLTWLDEQSTGGAVVF